MRILLGGSPCTHWSIAQKNNRETEAEGIGWELFRNYLIAKEKFKPDYFLYENNKSAAQPIKDQISKELGIPLQYINSALVSAQNRQRFYAHNIPNVGQPEDRGILLRDILESGNTYQEKSYCLTATEWKGSSLEHTLKKHVRTQIAEPIGVTGNGKSYVLTANYSNGSGANIGNYAAHTLTKGCKTMVAEPVRIGNIGSDSQAHRVYSCDGKSVTINAGGGGQGGKTGLYACPAEETEQRPVYEVRNGFITIKGKQYPIKLVDGYYIIRKLTVTECKRLQTVPDWYIMPCSASQNYKMLGNGWTVDVIAHILSHIPNIANEDIEVLSMYDGMSCGHIALDNLGAHITRYYASEIDKYAIQTTMANYPDTIQLGDAFQVREDGWHI